MFFGVSPEREPEGHARDERGDEARSAERARGPVGKRRAGAGDHLPPLPRDQVSAAGVDDDGRDHEPADHAADDPVADLLEQERRGAAAFRDLRFHVGHRHSGEQQRYADSVVEPALDVEPLADPPGDARLGDDRLPECGVGRRQHDRQDQGLFDGQLVEDDSGRDGAERDRQRQPDPEQAHRHRRPRDEAAGDRCARRRRTARAPASPPPAFARSRSSFRGRSRRAPRVPPAARPPRRPSPA